MGPNENPQPKNEDVSLIGNSQWLEKSPYEDDNNTEELSPLDDDYVREEYR